MTAERAAAAAIALAALLSARAASADEKQICSATAESAQSHRGAGKLVEAKREMVRCAQESCPRVVREACTGWLAEVDRELPSIVLRVVGPGDSDVVDVTVTSRGAPLTSRLDGQPILLDPGAYDLRLEAPGLEPKNVKVTVARGEQRRVVKLSMTRPPAVAAPRPSTLPGKVVFGVGVATGIAFGITEGVAWKKKSDLEDTCGKTFRCGDDPTGQVRTEFRVAAVLFTTSLVTLAAGTALWLGAATSTPKSAGQAPITVRLGVQPTGGALRVSF